VAGDGGVGVLGGARPLFGVIVRVCVPDGGPVEWWMAGGTILGASFGGLPEADHLPL
jgi:hypothetical protein